MPDNAFEEDFPGGEVDHEGEHLRVRRYAIADGSLINGVPTRAARGHSLALYVGVGRHEEGGPILLLTLTQEAVIGRSSSEKASMKGPVQNVWVEPVMADRPAYRTDSPAGAGNARRSQAFDALGLRRELLRRRQR